MGAGDSFPGDKVYSVKLFTHLHLMANGAIPPLPMRLHGVVLNYNSYARGQIYLYYWTFCMVYLVGLYSVLKCNGILSRCRTYFTAVHTYTSVL
jgi:hypothetical protein